MGEAYDNGVCLDWFEETQNLSNASYKPIRDQILQMEHLKLAFALEFLDSCGIRRDNIKFLRTDAIILSTPKKKMHLAKNALVNVTRQTLNQPKRWLFPQKTVMESSAGEGQIFRVFDCELPAQEKNGILFDQRPREPPSTSCHPFKSSGKRNGCRPDGVAAHTRKARLLPVWSPRL